MLPPGAVAQQVAPTLRELQNRYEEDATDSVILHHAVNHPSEADGACVPRSPDAFSSASVPRLAQPSLGIQHSDGQFDEEDFGDSDDEEDELEEHIWKAVLAGMLASAIV
jgi:hypothetical protein